jgi:hypothetical protein
MNTFSSPAPIQKTNVKQTTAAIEADASTATRPDDNATFSSTDTSYGLEITPNADLSAITLTVGSNTSGASRVVLADSAGNELVSKPWPGAGNTVSFQRFLTKNTSYIVFAEGTDYNPGYYDSASYPYSSTYVDIEVGKTLTTGGSLASQTGDALVFESVTGLPKGTVTLGWSQPSSVSRWETATFGTDPDGGYVEVYVETSGDGGSTWTDWQGRPVGSGTDLSSIPSSDRVRFRVELFPAGAPSTTRLTRLGLQYRP